MIIGEPLLIVGEHGEALLELSIFTRFVGSICLFGQSLYSAAFSRNCSGVNMGEPFC